MKIQWKRIAVWGAVLVIFALFCLWQNLWLTVTCHDFTHKDIPETFDRCRIVQISDLHNATFGHGNSRLLGKMEDLDPDYIVITGDVVDSNHTDIDTAVAFVEDACVLAPVYYVTGNHEVLLHSEERTRLFNGIRSVGAVILEDEAVTLEREGECITLMGLCDEGLGGGNLRQLAGTLDSTQFQLLLAHEPQYFDDYSEAGVDLVLSGHAHGGQFRFPFIGGVYAPDQGLFPELAEGIHTRGSTSMIVSRGLGNSVFPLRLFNFPEIICIELHSEGR